ncbi:hypothetical protein [Bradyrhizobium sp. HKCCYLS20291]|uniref:hypothetical protein n=1 Tax=Bradyrhizobium sp. HKCCYLS20291 TaxID=3420766 RepID=UPI003EBFD2D9
MHPGALSILTPSGDVSLTHRQLLGEISRAANLFRSYGIMPDGPTVAILCPILPQVFPALLDAQVAGVASSINHLLNEDTIVDLLKAQGGTVLVIPSEAADAAIWQTASNVAARVASPWSSARAGPCRGRSQASTPLADSLASLPQTYLIEAAL